ncbi:hypothetical protein QZH41_014755, partial [Actinostola sp. cb2023]
LAGSLVLGIGLFMCVFTSKLCERYTCRITMGVGLVSYATGFALSSLCRSIYPFYFTYSLLLGMGGSLTYTSMFISIRQYFDKHYSLAMGIGTAGVGLGTLAIGPAMQTMTDSFGWPNTFRIFAGAFVFFLLFVFVVDPNVEENQHEVTSSDSENPLKEETSIPRNIVLGFLDLSVWRFPEYTVSVIAIFAGSFGHYPALIHMVKYSEELSISPRKGSTLYVFFGAATITSRLISGRLCDVSFIKPRYIHQVGAILSGVSTILLSFAQNYTHLVIFAVFYGLADGAFRVTVNILFMNTVDPPRRPSAFGQANMVVSVATSAGPALAGLMADKMGTYKGAFYMAGTIAILGGAILFVHLCCFKEQASAHDPEQVKISGLEDRNQDRTGIGIVADHALARSGPQLDEPETTSL